jgi:hypothetical protein
MTDQPAAPHLGHRIGATNTTGLTLDELAAFVQACMRADLPGDTLLHAQIRFNGLLRSLETRPGLPPSTSTPTASAPTPSPAPSLRSHLHTSRTSPRFID